MNIALDARFYGTEHTGLGRYTTNVMAHLPQALSAQAGLQGLTLKVLLRKKYYDTLKLPSNCEKILCDIPHYSLAEQILLPHVLHIMNCELLYTFHFNVPLSNTLPTVVTVHDLIKSHFTGADTTTRSPWLFTLKRFGYNRVIHHTLTHATAIVTPTNTVKNDILALFPTVKPELIHPIPEAPDPIFQKVSKSEIRNPKLPTKYFLFVGNAYPHKNLAVLLDALIQLPNEHLVIVAKLTPFLTRLLNARDRSRIHILSNLTDSELVSVYAHAKALITPSLMEGYGLPGLEAMMVGTPVIASNIPVYREVYGDKVTYFDPRSVSGLIDVINNSNFKTRISNFSFTRSWSDVASDIAEVINASCTRLRSAQ